MSRGECACGGDPARGDCDCYGGDEMAAGFERFVEWPHPGFVVAVGRQRATKSVPVARAIRPCDRAPHADRFSRPDRK